MEDNNTMLDRNQPDEVSVGQTSSKWGLILGLVSIVFFLIMVFSGLTGNQMVSWIGYIPTIVIIILAHKDFKNEGDGFMSYGQGLGIGTLTVLIGALISTAFFYIYVKFIDASYLGIIKEKQIQGMQEQGMSDEQIDQAMSFSESFMSPEMMSVFAIIMTVIFGFILSLIISAFTKNSKPDFDV